MADSAISAPTRPAGQRTKFLVGGLVILAAMIYLIVSGTLKNAHYFLTVDEVHAQAEALTGQNIRVSGVVLGDSIQYDADSLTLRFTIAHIPDSTQEIEEQGGLAEALHRAASDSHARTLPVVVTGQPKPDLLRHEAQAILEGHLGQDGVFYADTLLLKCPTRYEEAVPEQVVPGD
jgi:cytochrome c-type biogenesis protein CcmE